MINFILYIFFGLVLLRITSLGIRRLASKLALLSYVKAGLFWLIISPLWLLYVLVGVAELINSTDIIQEKLFDTKTVYFSFCSDFKHDIFSCPDNEVLYTKKVDFKVSFDKQIVIKNSGATHKYSNCSIFDVNNWDCEDGEKTFGVHNGLYSEYNQTQIHPTIDKEGKPSIFPLLNSIDKFEYLRRELVNFFRNF